MERDYSRAAAEVDEIFAEQARTNYASRLQSLRRDSLRARAEGDQGGLVAEPIESTHWYVSFPNPFWLENGARARNRTKIGEFVSELVSYLDRRDREQLREGESEDIRSQEFKVHPDLEPLGLEERAES